MLKIKLFLPILLLSALFISSCTTSSTKTDNEPLLYDIQKDSLGAMLGKKITVIGKSVDLKLGAALVLADSSWLWIEDLEWWPEGYYLENGNGKTLQVTGTLIEKSDLPVFIANDSTVQQGIPMPQGTDLKKASHRYLLRNAKHIVILQ